MSTQTEAAADWRGKFSRNLHPDGREQSEVEMLDDEEQHSDHGLQQTENQKQKNLQAERRNCFRVFKFSLGVFCFLILAGLMTRNLMVSLENNRLKNRNNHLQTELSELMSSFSANNSRFQDELKQLKDENEGINKTLWDEIKQLKNQIEEKRCPEGWKRFGNSCYYKSTEEKTWIDSRSFCQFVGSDLVVVNSKEEQEFVSALNQNAESWIGLFAERSSDKSEWKWVDGSPLTETFWDEMFSKDPYDYYYAVFLSADGKWTEKDKTYTKNWICEK
ncbi:CD209 antigen-like protein A isoform X2 [Oryzias latipes]|uniref:CD209 antigen-like protein A isoform X2 n=1 Tax=Oryzias latipes TaxID=8090 RepID=UPI000CE172C0|nr:CD209 antigen-like protein A isoform X2 [Oryzias latipes]